MAEHCEKCGTPTKDKTERFCPGCRYAILDEMEQSGKLTPMPDISEHRVVLERDRVAGHQEVGVVETLTYRNPEG